MRKLPIILSTTALAVAVLGATPVGEAALATSWGLDAVVICATVAP